MSECNCPMNPDEGHDKSMCKTKTDEGIMCTKPANHDGPHAACSPAEHPAEVWE